MKSYVEHASKAQKWSRYIALLFLHPRSIMVVGSQSHRKKKLQNNCNIFSSHNLLMKWLFKFPLLTLKYNESHGHKSLNNLTNQSKTQNVIPAADILLLSHMCGFNSEKLNKDKSVISSFIIFTVLRTGGCDGRWIYSVLGWIEIYL